MKKKRIVTLSVRRSLKVFLQLLNGIQIMRNYIITAFIIAICCCRVKADPLPHPFSVIPEPQSVQLKAG